MTLVEEDNNNGEVMVHTKRMDARLESSTATTARHLTSPVGREVLLRREIVDYPDYACGFAAAVVNIYVTFPINKIIFRQMLHGQNVRSATADLKAEGFRTLYRGVGPPLIQRSVSLALMFGTFGSYHRLLDSHTRHVIPDYGRFCLAAFLAGSTEALLCPFERIQMLLQDDRKHHMYTNTIDAFKKLGVHGLREYYRGLTVILLRNGPSNILFFTFRDELKQFFSRHCPQGKISKEEEKMSTALKLMDTILHSDLARDFASGSLIGAFISTIFYPLNVVRTQMQTQQPGSRHLSFSEAFTTIFEARDRSVRMLYRGFHVNYTRSFLSWGIINACYEMFHKMIDHSAQLHST